MLNDWIENCRKYVLRYLLIIAILFVSKNIIQKLLIGLGKLFNFESTEFKIGYIILIILGFSSYLFLIDKKFIVSKKGHFLAIALFSSYLIFRFFDNGVIYLPEPTLLKYIDVVVLFFLLHCIHWSNIKLLSSITNSNSKDFFINDAVFVDGEIDNELIVQKLITSIKGYKPKNSFSIGINAEWGFGKSTFLHRFDQEFRKTNSETIMFWFHIWKNKGDKAIIDNFFKEFATNLKPHSAEIEDNIEKYTDAILSVSPGEISNLIRAGKDIFREDHSLEGYYQKIQEAIKRINRQIIIILDDLDRLENNEILDTYKIIRTLSDFDNVIFLAGYDRNYLEKTLGDSKENYINKIFQVEIDLLPFDESQINEMLLDGIKKAFPHRINQEDKQEEHIRNEKLFLVFNSLFAGKAFQASLDLSNISLDNLLNEETQFSCSDLKLDYKYFIRTYRDLKRFLNEFKFSKTLINTNDIYLPDYVLFRLLTFRYKNLHHLVFEKISNIIDNKDYDVVNEKMTDSWNETDGSHYIYTESSKEKLFDTLKANNYNLKDIEIINASLCILFGEKSKAFYETNQYTISKSYYTNFYLRNGIPNDAYTVSKFKESFYAGNIVDLINKMKGLSQNVRLQAFNELKLYLFSIANSVENNKADFSKFIIALNHFEFISLVNDFKEVEKIIQNFSEKTPNLTHTDLKDALINSNIIIGPLDRFLADVIINAARKERDDIYTKENSIEYANFPFNVTDTKNILLEKFENVLKQNVGYNIHFSYYTLQVDFIAVDFQIILAFKADKLFKKHIQRNFLHFLWVGYLDFKAEPEGFPQEHQTYKPNDFLCQIFCNITDWKALKAHKKNKDIYKQFRENGFKNYNEYLMTEEIENIIVGEDHKSKLERIKKLMKVFIANDCKPLNRKQFAEVK
ncbi:MULTISPECIES: P-loop NTPase fold protein [Aequorivita]|uniref:KAP NTPase domain-containing protein n=1 Tax=Aequorivita iocasae TaxID=2803865 RepID=A0ABX7DPI6_9FLAO|nr:MULTISPECIES: P-loop NTPase fold protein [Aequorivita]QQX75989.1 hypothetical protein JK629_11675 [Aequorivita iocasae]UCA55450.1 KAP family NTPase [Aequorivita sp. F7]